MKKLILLTILIFVVALNFCACNLTPDGTDAPPFSQDNPPAKDPPTQEPPVTEPPTGDDPNNNQTTTKSAEEFIAEYLVALGDNFSVLANVKSSLENVVFGQSTQYLLRLDGAKLEAAQDNDVYYLEETDGTVYLYTRSDDGWHKTVAQKDFTYPTNVADKLTQWLANVYWEEYNDKTGVAKGSIELDGNELWIECSLKSEQATISIYKIQDFVGFEIKVEVAKIEIYDIGTTTVTLPSPDEVIVE